MKPNMYMPEHSQKEYYNNNNYDEYYNETTGNSQKIEDEDDDDDDYQSAEITTEENYSRVPPRRGGTSNNIPNENFQPKRRMSIAWIIFIVIFSILVVTAIIVLAVLFLVQRTVSFDVVSFNINNDALNRSSDGFSISANPDVHILNDNFFDITLDNIQLNLYHNLYVSGTKAIGYSLINDDVITLHRRSSTEYSFIFFLLYSRTADNELLFLKSMVNTCSLSSPDNVLNFSLDIYTNYHMWAKSGDIHEIRSLTIPCPINALEASKINAFLSGG